MKNLSIFEPHIENTMLIKKNMYLGSIDDILSKLSHFSPRETFK